MARPEDRLLLTFKLPEGSPQPERFRWWKVVQPPPSVAFALQGRVAAALGEAGLFAVDALFASPDQAEDLEAETALLGDALAARTLRRSRAGAPIAALAADDVRNGQARLWAVLSAATRRARGGMDSLLLLGEPERERGQAGYRWRAPSLLHALLMYSELQFDGEDPRGPRQVPVDRSKLDERAPPETRLAGDLREAVVDGSLSAFSRALDAMLCGPDEMALLSTWAVLHLLRPF
jgi:hypothetical protein